MDVVQIALRRARPIVYSLGGVRDFINPRDSGSSPEECQIPRNLSSRQGRAMAKSGGVVGLGFWPQADCGSEPVDYALFLKFVIHEIDRMKDPASGSEPDGTPIYEPTFASKGICHVSLGSDDDGNVRPTWVGSIWPISRRHSPAAFAGAEIGNV